MDQSGPTSDPGTPAPSSSGWAAPPPQVQAGPEGFVYADVPNRAIAYIIDAIILGDHQHHRVRRVRRLSGFGVLSAI